MIGYTGYRCKSYEFQAGFELNPLIGYFSLSTIYMSISPLFLAWIFPR